ncbi:hypothetical protein PRIPAC_84048 [Pristionchus pacificus]|nr:hypothetical protein PRIPAC_84048 [Pristionchus pacificus]
MRFLLYFPLFLLLILIQSVGAPLVNGSSLADGEGSSPSPPNNDDLSLEEVQNKLEIAIAEVAQLQSKVDNARKALNEKQKGALVPFNEYNQSKVEWKRRKDDLDALQSSKELAELKRKAQEARKILIKAEEAFSTINKTVNDQEEELKDIEVQIKRIDQTIKDIEDTPNKLASEQATLNSVTTEIRNTITLISNLADDITTKTNDVEACDSKVTWYQSKFDAKQCSMKVKTGECAEPDRLLTEWKGKQQTAQKKLAAVLKLKLNADNKLTELNNKKITAEKNVITLTKDNKRIKQLVNAQIALKEPLEDDKNSIEPELIKARKDKEKAEEEIESAKAAKNEAESKETSYSNDELKRATEAEEFARNVMSEKEEIIKPLEGPLNKLQSDLNDLESQLSQSNKKVSALRDRLNKLTPKAASSDGLTLIISLAVISAVLVVVVIGVIVFFVKRNRKHKETITSHAPPPTEPSILPFAVEEASVKTESVPKQAKDEPKDEQKKAEVEAMRVDDLPYETDHDKIKKDHILTVIKGKEITIRKSKSKGLIMNYTTGNGSETMFSNGSKMSCLNHYAFIACGNKPNIEAQSQSPNPYDPFVTSQCTAQPLNDKYRSQQFPESYETMLKKIKDYDPAKYELHRTAAGRDESAHEGAPESSGVQKDDDTQPTVTKPDKEPDVTQKTITKKDVEDQPDDAEAVMIPSQRQEIVQKKPKRLIIAEDASEVPHDTGTHETGPTRPFFPTMLSKLLNTTPAYYGQLPEYLQDRVNTTRNWSYRTFEKVLLEIVAWRKGRHKSPFHLPIGDRIHVIKRALLMLAEDGPLHEIKEGKYTVRVYGDLRGNLGVFFKDSDLLGGIGSKKWREHKFVFLGNYINSEPHSVDVVMILLLIKLFYKNIVLLHGYYEEKDVNDNFGFRAMLRSQFQEHGDVLFQCINYTFSKMVYGCLIGRRLLVHSGIPNDTDPLQTKTFDKTMFSGLAEKPKLRQALLMNQPERGLTGFANARHGSAECFGETAASAFRGNSLDIIIRSGQPIEGGFEFFDDRHMVSIFSLIQPGKMNHAAVLVIEKNGEMHFSKYIDHSTTESQYRTQEESNKFKSSLPINSDNQSD